MITGLYSSAEDWKYSSKDALRERIDELLMVIKRLQDELESLKKGNS